MALTQAGLPNAGQTGRYEFSYDDSLSDERGSGLATATMAYCDDDWTWLRGFFPTASVGPSGSRIQIHLTTVSDGSASWSGYGLVTYTVDINIGEAPLFGVRAVDMVRMLIIAEVSEMLMRERRGALNPNEWFATWDEGSKGEALSRIFSIEFFRTWAPEVIAMPGTLFQSVSAAWLDSPARADFVSTDADDNSFDARNGCGTLFLAFLKDQLGFPLQNIIDNGSKQTLADVFTNLTGEPSNIAFSRFADLVDLHYPASDGPYGVPFDTVFPVPNLDRITTPAQISWVANGNPPTLDVVLDMPAVVDTTVHLTSSDPNLVHVPKKAAVSRIDDRKPVTLTVTPQGASFQDRSVTLTATYAGRMLTADVEVIHPQEIPLQPLRIALSADDLCSNPFETGTAVTARIDNLNVFADPSALAFAWTVTGATANLHDTPELEIDALPGAGSQVTVSVTVTKSNGLTAHGELVFLVADRLSRFNELDRRVRCKLASTVMAAQFIPPWVPITVGPLTLEHVEVVQKELSAPLAALVELDKSLRELADAHREQASAQIQVQR